MATVCETDAGGDELLRTALGSFVTFQYGILGGIWEEALRGACLGGSKLAE